MSKIDNRFLLIMLGILIAIVVFVSLLVSSLSGKTQVGLISGLQKQESDKPEVITEQDLEKEYKERTPFTDSSVRNFDDDVRSALSSGDYKKLDKNLEILQNAFRDGTEAETGLDTSYSAVIDMYRSDIANILALPNSPCPESLLCGFYMPETLASAIVYASVSEKIDAFINEDSILLPPVSAVDTNNTNLTQANLSFAEKKVLVDNINLRLNESSAIVGAEEFTFFAYGEEFTVTVVCLQNYCWAPYSLMPTNANYQKGVKVSELKTLRTSYKVRGETLDLDAFIVM